MLTSILQPTHLLIALTVAILALGPKRLPEASRGPEGGR
jgi:Sec-independent protein translocase protein TatA